MKRNMPKRMWVSLWVLVAFVVTLFVYGVLDIMILPSKGIEFNRLLGYPIIGFVILSFAWFAYENQRLDK